MQDVKSQMNASHVKLQKKIHIPISICNFKFYSPLIRFPNLSTSIFCFVFGEGVKIDKSNEKNNSHFSFRHR